MTTEQEKRVEQELELKDNSDVLKSAKTKIKKNKWLFILGGIAILIGGIIFWRSSSTNEQSSEEVTNNIEQARLTVRTVPVNLEPIRAWVYGDGNVNAIIKKHLTFQATGTINYLKQIDGRDLREGDRVKKGNY